jgi:hypothetical protein
MPIAGRLRDLKGRIWHCLRVLLLATILVVRAEDGDCLVDSQSLCVVNDQPVGNPKRKV